MTVNISDYISDIPLSHPYGGILGQGVVEGMAPFHVRRIDIEVSFEIDFNAYLIYVDAIGETWRYAHYEPVDIPLMNEYPEKAIWELSQKFKQVFRQRVADFVPDSVVLGEN